MARIKGGLNAKKKHNRDIKIDYQAFKSLHSVTPRFLAEKDREKKTTQIKIYKQMRELGIILYLLFGEDVKRKHEFLLYINRNETIRLYAKQVRKICVSWLQ